MTLAPEPSGEYFEGWGGNFVFCHTGPEVDYLLSNLRVAWARSGMSLSDWEPRNDNASADSMNWSCFNARVSPGSPLDKEFRAAQDLEQRGIPHIISVWWLPTWLQPTEGTALPAAKWGERREMAGELAFSIPPLGLGIWKASSPQPKVGSVTVTSVPGLGGSVLFAGLVGAAGVGSERGGAAQDCPGTAPGGLGSRASACFWPHPYRGSGL